MTSRTQQARSEATNTPPGNNTLVPGQIFLELADPMKLWVGVPTGMDATGRKKLLDAGSLANALNKSGDTATGLITFNAGAKVANAPLAIASSSSVVVGDAANQGSVRLLPGTASAPGEAAFYDQTGAQAGYAGAVGAPGKLVLGVAGAFIGWTLSGNTDFAGTVTLHNDPGGALEAATKQYVDASTAIASAAVRRSGDTMTGLLTLSGDPTGPLGAATRQYVDVVGGVANAAVKRAGDTMTGILTLSGDPVNVLDAATKRYADKMVPLAGGTMTGALVLNNDPQTALAAATKQYVDNGIAVGVAPYLKLAGGNLTGNTYIGATLALPGDNNLPSFVTPFLTLPYVTTGGNPLPTIAYNAYHNAGGWATFTAGYSGFDQMDTVNGIRRIGVWPTGAAGASVGTAQTMTLDYRGFVSMHSVTVPADSGRQWLSLANATIGVGGAYAQNLYTASGNWKTLAAGYSFNFWQDNTQGNVNIYVYNTAAAGTVVTGAQVYTFSAAGLLTVPTFDCTGRARSLNGRFISMFTANPTLTVYNTTTATAYCMVCTGSDLAFYTADNTGAPVNVLFSYQSSGPNFFWQKPGTNTWFIMRASDNLSYNALGAGGGNGAYVNVSDARIKTDIEPAPYGLNEVLALNPIRYHRTSQADPAQRELGFAAQDVEMVIPEAVVLAGFDHIDTNHLDTSDDPMRGLQETALIPALVNAIKELARRVIALENPTGVLA